MRFYRCVYQLRCVCVCVSLHVGRQYFEDPFSRRAGQLYPTVVARHF